MSSNIYKYELPCIAVVATVRSKHMDTVILVRSLWVILFISMAIVDLKADNNTTTSQGNATSSSLAVAEIPSGGNGQVRNETAPSYTNQVVINNKNKHQGRGGSGGSGGGGGGGGGGYSWGWGGGGGGGGGGRGRGGGGGGGGGWGWGGGGGGAGWWKWGCGGGKGRGGRSGSRNHHRYHRDHDHVYRGKRRFDEADYAVGEFAQCMRKGRCKGMRLDCPLHCGGPCYYDCQYMCKAHCKRRRS